jgi:hypothetical protein
MTKKNTRRSLIMTTTNMLLMMLAFQMSFQAVHGAISCQGDVPTTSCNADNTFTCDTSNECNDAFLDAAVITGVQGKTSICKGSATATDVCDGLSVTFDATDTNAQGMICEGPGACDDVEVRFPKEKGTVTCTGGTLAIGPACSEMTIFGGCIICKDDTSCRNIFAYEKTERGQFIGFSGPATAGSYGFNCPEDEKTSLPCFSGSNTVQVQDKGPITMDTLKIGDFVKTGCTQEGKSEYLPVISFMHVDPHAEVEYRQIYTNVSPAVPLEISGDHLLFLQNDKVVRARDVQVGDTLKGDSASNMVVTHIMSIQRQGLYAPVTANGKIWVSGVTASSYISLMDEEIVSHKMQSVLSHMALAPLRMVCTMGSFSICQGETYSDDGYSMNLWTLIQFGHYFSTLAKPFQYWMLIFVAPSLLVLGCMEMALEHCMWTIIGLLITTKMIIKSKKAAAMK